jgi:hypothetical protein
MLFHLAKGGCLGITLAATRDLIIRRTSSPGPCVKSKHNPKPKYTKSSAAQYEPREGKGRIRHDGV